MMKPLRKRHLQIWIALALLLPAGIVSAWLYVPGAATIESLKKESPALLPEIAYSVEGNCYTANLRSNQPGTSWQLEWKNKAPLQVPSAVIYRRINNEPDITKNELVGRIEARGNYIFPLNANTAGAKEMKFFLYDFIHQATIDSLIFKL
ncbi:MAG: hypothetical protein ABIN67_21030 [Ferruginibacter sp.]